MPNLATFGTAPDPDSPDTITVQGKVYRLQPIGMRAMRSLLRERSKLQALAANPAGASEEDAEAGVNATKAFILDNVVAEQREQLSNHIEESVGIQLLREIGDYMQGGALKGAAVDPTQPPSSSDGSSADGPTSTATASAEAST